MYTVKHDEGREVTSESFATVFVVLLAMLLVLVWHVGRSQKGGHAPKGEKVSVWDGIVAFLLLLPMLGLVIIELAAIAAFLWVLWTLGQVVA